MPQMLWKSMTTVNVTELKCQFANGEYDILLEDTYGIEICNFKGYKSPLTLLLEIDLMESGNECFPM